MKITSKYQHIATYDAGEGFYVDITREDGLMCGSALVEWIWHEDHAAKAYMIGLVEKTTPLDKFIEMIEGSIEEDKEVFKALYMEEN